MKPSTLQLDLLARIDEEIRGRDAAGEPIIIGTSPYTSVCPCALSPLSPATREIASREGLASTHAVTLFGHHPLTPSHLLTLQDGRRFRPTRPARRPKGRPRITLLEVEEILG